MRKRRWLYVLLAYAVVLLASNLVRLSEGRRARPLPEQKVAKLGRVEVAYTDAAPAEVEAPPVVLLLHGTPLASDSFEHFAPTLAKTCRVLNPDLPGFGRSTRDIPDYSIAAHAKYMLHLLDALDVDAVHLVAYSQGGGVALEMAKLAPQRVRSITMLSSIGVQELELLGDYHVNHALHLAQWAILWLVENGVPHFGYLDDTLLNVPYARNFLDSDQRPLRRILEEYAGPMLIVHGQEDGLVPAAAAQEHHRIVPQSELAMLEGGHMLLFTEGDQLAGRVNMFLLEVDRANATVRATADPERVELARQPFDETQRPQATGITLAVLMLLLALATFVSEDLACIGGGLIAANGTMGFVPAAVACGLGIFLGDLMLYWLGRFVGRPATRIAPLKWFIREEALQQGADWFRHKGPIVIVLSRFLPGSRLPTFVAAGVLHANFWKLTAWVALAGLVWTPILVGFAYVVGGSAMRWFVAYQKYTLLAVAGLIFLLWAFVELVVPSFTFRGRRLLLSRWRRLTRWEFWPLWAFYPPVVLYILWLAIKHRSLTLFTAANPAMFAGGFLGESKSEILKGLAGSPEFVARHALVKSPAEARAFMERERLAFPIVLKPNVGQRGLGVAVVRSDGDLDAYFRTQRGDTIAQEYVAGQEFGVFYYRYPNEPKGHVYSITEKRMVSVTGDGNSTLERLILGDDRAVCMARFFLKLHHEHLDEVPAAGQVVPLTELGTHCRGAVFLDGGHVKTPELEDAIDRISKGYEGFFFGRYDIRTPSVEEFKGGRNFRILELNGVTSEATHIYEPGHSIRAGWQTIMQQWRICFEIAEQNRARGIAPVSSGKLLAALAEYKPASEAQ